MKDTPCPVDTGLIHGPYRKEAYELAELSARKELLRAKTSGSKH